MRSNHACTSGTTEAPSPLADDEPSIGQHLEMMGHRGLRAADGLNEVADACFPGRSGDQEAQQAETNRVGEHGEVPGRGDGSPF